jgi:hypothetical protein
MVNLSARLRAFYDALAEIESHKRGRVITRQELMRKMPTGKKP